MAKIISVSDTTVKIGQDDGSLREVRIEDCNFVPAVGDRVEIFSNETSVQVVKADPKPEPVEQKAAKPAGEGINITISNDNNTAGVPGPVYAQTGKVVNKVAYVLLAILLGSIGVHKFYAGKTGMGILYLVFCWTGLPAIAGLIEGIIALTKSADAYGNIVV